MPIASLTVDVGEAADAAQRVAHHVGLPRELAGIAQMLNLAAAARAEDRTKRLRAHTANPTAVAAASQRRTSA